MRDASDTKGRACGQWIAVHYSTGTTAVLPDAYETNPSLENRPPYYVLAYIMRYG